MSFNPVPFGKYELLTRLAAGGMAEIFLARTKSIQGFEKYLVIKKILRNRTNDQEFVRMFLDEARVAATLDHPNIVQIYDVGHVDTEYFIAMEYLRGHNLIEIVRAGAKLGYSKPPLEHVISMLTGVSAGLHYAHEKADFNGRPLEIVHRDVTPQNVVVSFDGGVKIVDFGIAKAATREVETLAGTLKGKIGYMSPEQCRGQPVDRRSDIFALGIILYELTTGKRLYHERSDFETLKKIIEGPVPSPRDILPFYPAALNQIVMRCLAKDAADRYQTVRDFHQDLDAFARDNQLVIGTVPLAQYMERIFADELAAQKSGDPAAMLFASQMQTSTSAPSYLGESSRRSSKIVAPLVSARRQHMLTRVLQGGAVVAVLGAAGGFVWWKTRPPSSAPLPSLPMNATASTGTGATPAPATTGNPTVAGTPNPAGTGTTAPAGTPPTGPATATGPATGPATPTTAPANPTPAPGPATPPPAATAKTGPGPAGPRGPAAPRESAHLTILAEPKCEVLFDGMPVGQTPILDNPVAAGKHTISLLNSTAGVRESIKINLQPGQLWARSFTIKDGKLITTTGANAKLLASNETKGEPARSEPAGSAKKDDPPATKPKAAEGPATSPVVAAPPPKKEDPPPAPKPAPTPQPEAASTSTRNVAGFVLEAQKVGGVAAQLPESFVANHRGQRHAGTYKICVSPAGKVYDVQIVSGIPGADGDIVDTIKRWTYKPQTSNVCANKLFAFQVP